ncbi:MAG: DNA replication/repair protein RecF [Oscillospiraceae bacterium]|jgi:DNA replication and repair protein RecF|nr:DNA replication/repair protein RecF [Oscillospiraceae bacterium]
MTVNQLFLNGFRNYDNVSIQFCDGVNVISGRNAQGKTNLIEAVYYLATGRTFRGTGDKDLIRFDNERASIKAEIVSCSRNQTLEARFSHGRRRELFANGVKLKKATELTGRLTTVLFSPDDLTIIKDGATVRRKLMDNCLSQLRPGYLAALTEFNKLYEHKTRILRDHYEKPSLLDLLGDFNLRLAHHSAQLIFYRSAFSEGLTRRATKIHNDFSSGQEELTIKYKTVGKLDPLGKKASDILPYLLEHQEEHYTAELRAGLCLSGAHKDDLEIEINGISARKYASQGQARTAAVSIKLAERDIHCDQLGEYPVLLLDDVLSELDATRQGFILEKIEDGQVFITCCDETTVGAKRSGKTIKIENGKLMT